MKFVLSGSGHIAGVINPASSDKYGFWLNPNTPPNPDDWFKDAVQQEGSWWPDWLTWLQPHAGPQVPAARRATVNCNRSRTRRAPTSRCVTISKRLLVVQ